MLVCLCICCRRRCCSFLLFMDDLDFLFPASTQPQDKSSNTLRTEKKLLNKGFFLWDLLIVVHIVVKLKALMQKSWRNQKHIFRLIFILWLFQSLYLCPFYQQMFHQKLLWNENLTFLLAAIFLVQAAVCSVSHHMSQTLRFCSVLPCSSCCLDLVLGVLEKIYFCWRTILVGWFLF